jgi:glycosyltransferase involved in cell wall biosynthesis
MNRVPSPVEARGGASDGDRFAVMVTVFNGEAFLEQQLDTLAGQSVPHVDIWVSDDGSSDGSRALLERYAGRWNKGAFHIADGPAQGFAENFRSLVTNPAIEADYFAFCDQDDLWEADQLARASAWLAIGDPSTPRLFGGRTRIVDARGAVSGHSPLFRKAPSFRNALVQSIAGGNTMVFNRAARDLMATAAVRAPFVAHDWWAYQIVTATGGACRYDPEPAISYRQHGGNQIGENDSWGARLRRVQAMLDGTMVGWNDRNIAALEACPELLTPEAVAVLSDFRAMRTGRLPGRLIAFFRSGIYRQTTLGQLGLLAACVLRRL